MFTYPGLRRESKDSTLPNTLNCGMPALYLSEEILDPVSFTSGEFLFTFAFIRGIPLFCLFALTTDNTVRARRLFLRLL